MKSSSGLRGCLALIRHQTPALVPRCSTARRNASTTSRRADRRWLPVAIRIVDRGGVKALMGEARARSMRIMLVMPVVVEWRSVPIGLPSTSTEPFIGRHVAGFISTWSAQGLSATPPPGRSSSQIRNCVQKLTANFLQCVEHKYPMAYPRSGFIASSYGSLINCCRGLETARVDRSTTRSISA